MGIISDALQTLGMIKGMCVGLVFGYVIGYIHCKWRNKKCSVNTNK